MNKGKDKAIILPILILLSLAFSLVFISAQYQSQDTYQTQYQSQDTYQTQYQSQDTYQTQTQNQCEFESKSCSDGSLVSRNSNNNCEFDACPGTQNQYQTQTKTQTQNQYQTQTRLQVEKSSEPVKFQYMTQTQLKQKVEQAIQTQLQDKIQLKTYEVNMVKVAIDDKLQNAYEVTSEHEGTILGLFKVKAKVYNYVNSENGQLIRTKYPFYMFMFRESLK